MKIGNYEVIREIGEGGFATTYEVRHLFLGEKACLKQNLNLTATDEELLRKEAKLIWNVHHHSLPALRDYFPVGDGSAALVMSYIEGKDFHKSIKKHKALHPEDVSWITQRLLNALYYLHSKGIVHCDIKPANIIVQPSEHNAVLVDYGLSSIRPTRMSKADGYTAIFAAPELMAAKPPLPESDLYSLGLTMIYALGGDPIKKSLPDHVPKKLQEFFLELVKYDPKERPRWESSDLVKKLSDIREEAFGRRNSQNLDGKIV